MSEPSLSGVVVHWNDAAALRRLVAAWPELPRYELVVVDNSGSAGALPARVRCVRPGRNLGFGGGANRGAAEARGTELLFLNPDARPEPGAVDALAASFAAFPDAAGVVPALFGPDGASQHRWQLRPLPSIAGLLGECLGIPVAGPVDPPPRGTPIGQPAAAALALRRRDLEEVGGFDEGFHPAWFEDVDLARRLAARGRPLRYEPGARFVHERGASVPVLGYAAFLWIYHRNMQRYARLHHGPGGAALVGGGALVGAAARMAALPVRRPRRAVSRAAAARALWGLALGVATRWRRPRALAREVGAVR